MTAPTRALPASGDELEEVLADPKRRAEILASQGSLVEFIRGYQQKASADVREQVLAEMRRTAPTAGLPTGGGAGVGDGPSVDRLAAEEAQRLLLDLLRGADPALRPTSMLTSHRQATGYNASAAGAKVDGKFKSAVDYFRCIWHLNEQPDAVAKRAEIRNAFGSTAGADGGFLVPETLRANLLQVALEQAIVRPRSTVLPMEAPRVPIPMIDSKTNQGSILGGMVAYWGEEGAALTDASMTFGRVELDAKKLTGLSVVPNELLNDSLISFAALIESKWPMALAWFEDVAFISGTGSGEPKGFLGNDATVVVDKQAGQPAATVAVENINRMYSRMLPSSLTQAVWLCSPGCIPELFEMALSVGTGGAPVMITNVAGAPAMMIYGRPLIVTEKLKALGTQGDIAFVDLSYYLVGDRQTMTAASSTEWKFGNDQTAFRIIQRVDGRPWIQSAITPANGSSTLSPFVELAARS